MSSTGSQNQVVASKLASDTIVSFKPESELKQYITLKTKITKTFFTFGEIMAILRTIIEEEKQYEERNPALIICSEELKQILKCPALHYKELESEVINHLAFTHEYLEKVEDPKSHSPKSKCGKCVNTQIWISNKSEFKLKSPFLKLIQAMIGVNPNRTVFTYEEICDLVCRYIWNRRDQFYHDQDTKVCWIKGDLLETCFDVDAFHWIQLKALIWSQLIPTRRSPRHSN